MDRARYQSCGRLERALEIYKDVLEQQKRTLGDAHPDVATTLFNMGNVYGRQEKWAEMFEKHELALTIRVASLGESHPSTAMVRQVLAANRSSLEIWSQKHGGGN